MFSPTISNHLPTVAPGLLSNASPKPSDGAPKACASTTSDKSARIPPPSGVRPPLLLKGVCSAEPQPRRLLHIGANNPYGLPEAVATMQFVMQHIAGGKQESAIVNNYLNGLREDVRAAEQKHDFTDHPEVLSAKRVLSAALELLT